jgi:WD40 repeat protein
MIQGYILPRCEADTDRVAGAHGTRSYQTASIGPKTAGIAFLEAAFAVDGQRIVTASRDHSERVWERPPGQLITSLEGHGASVSHVASSSIITVSEDKTAFIWIAAAGSLLTKLEEAHV